MPNAAATPATAPATPVATTATIPATATGIAPVTPAAATPITATPATTVPPATTTAATVTPESTAVVESSEEEDSQAKKPAAKEVIDLTQEIAASSAKISKCASDICVGKYTGGPLPVTGNLKSAAYETPTNAWIEKAAFKYECLMRLVVKLLYHFKLEKMEPPTLKKAQTKEARAETAARRLGFLPKGETVGHDHCAKSIKKWMPEVTQSSFIPFLNSIECLLGNELDVSTRSTNEAMAQQIVSSLVAAEDETKVMLKIIVEMTVTETEAE
jgi:hypothetical protein